MNIEQVTFGTSGRVIKYFIAPCGTKLRSQKEVARFLDPDLKPAKYTKAKRLELLVDQIPYREDLHPEDWKVTRDVDPSVFAAHSAHHQVGQNAAGEYNLHNRVSHITPFFELGLVLLTTHAIGLYEVTKKFQRYRQ